ncbi:Translation initiation factor IF-2 [Pseudomonas syringae pv. actinidiae]|uniref:Translation initiation factor IF-2 n=1 Tax=Pseudomonas syringae pv. actinidiae TaxID=103796 RepID=A0A2V0QK18_PSESF|nr:Translation initiation factor IF-2 [Pseudomonas syringae pv. actinidiae]
MTAHTRIAAAFQKLAEFFNDQRLVIDHQNFWDQVVIHMRLHAVKAGKPGPLSIQQKHDQALFAYATLRERDVSTVVVLSDYVHSIIFSFD